MLFIAAAAVTTACSWGLKKTFICFFCKFSLAIFFLAILGLFLFDFVFTSSYSYFLSVDLFLTAGTVTPSNRAGIGLVAQKSPLVPSFPKNPVVFLSFRSLRSV